MLRKTASGAIPVLFLLLLLTGCSLLEPQPELVIPGDLATPIPTAPPLESFAPDEIVIDPVSDVVPTVDPFIEALLQAVSQQQLTAYVRTLEGFGTRNAFSDTQSETTGIGATRRWIFNEFQRVGGGRLQVEFQDFPLVYNGFSAEQSNVIATLPGTDPAGGVIIVMAHYDTRSADATDGFSRTPGANDNGSGVALLLESARILSARQWPQTIMFVATSAEEQGSYGARWLAENAFLDNMNIIGVINYDGVGGRAGIPQSVRLFASDFIQSPMGALGRYYEYIAGLYLPTFPVYVIDGLDREGRWGDQQEFVKLGLPAIRIIESEENPDLVNSTTDTWDKIDYEYLRKVVQANVAVVANMAGAPLQAQPPTIATMAEPGSFLLTWPVSEQAAGYAISFRPNGSAGYPPFRFVRAERAGNVALTGMDPNTAYSVSLAAIDENGMLGAFSPEFTVGPATTSSAASSGN